MKEECKIRIEAVLKGRALGTASGLDILAFETSLHPDKKKQDAMCPVPDTLVCTWNLARSLLVAGLPYKPQTADTLVSVLAYGLWFCFPLGVMGSGLVCLLLYHFEMHGRVLHEHLL